MSLLTARTLQSILAVPAAAWDACAGDDNPFVSHAFLSALEESGSACAETGWQPLPVLIEDANGTLIAAAPCYLKSHSQGEYVFDHAWADAFARAGGRYYPKLQICVPFTPATGPRLLVRPDYPDAKSALVEVLAGLQERLGVSSTHVTFAPEDDCKILEDHGFLRREDVQFHWFNENYTDFEGFLAGLASRKRKSIRREREAALENGVTIEWVTGDQITEAHLDDFFIFYTDTGSRKWGAPYLTREFYSRVRERMADKILSVFAYREGRRIAGAINFIGKDTLYGRHWGCIEEHPFLHFEVCYYQAIDFAIRHRLKRVEAGAQGEHKLARGYRPVKTFSAHSIAHEGLRRAIKAYLQQERQAIENVQCEMLETLPFRKSDEGPIIK